MRDEKKGGRKLKTSEDAKWAGVGKEEQQNRKKSNNHGREKQIKEPHGFKNGEGVTGTDN